MRKVHLGKRLDESSLYSLETHQLDSQTVASAVSDVVKHALSQDTVNKLLGAVEAASKEAVPASKMKDFLKAHVTKENAEKIVDIYNSPDVVNLPAGNTAWRFSNAISWFANQAEVPESKVELQKLAFEALNW